MFERYTEKARRAIFFARYEAQQFGAPQIETEHLLLGLLREDQALTRQFLGPDSSVQSIRDEIESRTPARAAIAGSADMKLSNQSKRVLAYAAEEAESLGHRHIGTEHLLLGLLREEKCRAAAILREAGVSLRQVRKEVMKSPPPSVQPGTPATGRPTVIGEPYVRVSMVDEDGSAIEEVVWRAGGFRLPHAGEALEIARDEGLIRYRVADIVWQATSGPEAPAQMTRAILKLRRESPHAG